MVLSFIVCPDKMDFGRCTPFPWYVQGGGNYALFNICMPYYSLSIVHACYYSILPSQLVSGANMGGQERFNFIGFLCFGYSPLGIFPALSLFTQALVGKKVLNYCLYSVRRVWFDFSYVAIS